MPRNSKRYPQERLNVHIPVSLMDWVRDEAERRFCSVTQIVVDSIIIAKHKTQKEYEREPKQD